MTKKPFQMSRIRIPGKTVVRNDFGVPILCAWDDCQNSGYDEIKVIVTEQGKRLHYIFCSEQHRQLHINGHHEYGKLPK